MNGSGGKEDCPDGGGVWTSKIDCKADCPTSVQYARQRVWKMRVVIFRKQRWRPCRYRIRCHPHHCSPRPCIRNSWGTYRLPVGKETGNVWGLCCREMIWQNGRFGASRDDWSRFSEGTMRSWWSAKCSTLRLVGYPNWRSEPWLIRIGKHTLQKTSSFPCSLTVAT